ncbi:MAG: sigma-E processing peptidase SpoIIGA [Clostridia bacterium]|nr:sigma-E processing peptidase SpoIIGA [Clostridia bacterium]
MTIYLDIILLENLCMNYIILFATGLINKVVIKQIRIILASILGGIYAIASFFPISEIYSGLVLKIILSIVMIYVSFVPKNAKNLFKQLIIFYLVSFAFGGCSFALLYFIKPQNILMKNGILTGTYPLKIAILGGILGFIIVNIAFKLVKGKISKKDMFCELEIEIQRKVAKIKAMIDTGNLLKDPISNIPVIVVEAKQLENVIPNTIIENLNKLIGGEKEDVILDIGEEYMSKFRIIPFTSLGKQNGLLLGIKADSVLIKTLENEKVIKNVIIGIYDKYLTKTGDYTGLIGLDILERTEKNEAFANIKM